MTMINFFEHRVGLPIAAITRIQGVAWPVNDALHTSLSQTDAALTTSPTATASMCGC